MIGEWIANNVGEAIAIAGIVWTGSGWALYRWLDEKFSKQFEPIHPVLSEADKAQELDAMARKVLATSILHEYTASTASSVLRSGEFWDATVGVVIKDKGVQEFVDGRVKHGIISHETAMRLIVTDATRSAGEAMQKSLSDSQAMLLAELRGFRSEMLDAFNEIRDRVGEVEKDLEVHKAKSPG